MSADDSARRREPGEVNVKRQNQTANDEAARPRQLLTVGQAAAMLALGRSKLYALMDAGELAYVKMGKSRRVRLADVEALIERSLVIRGVRDHAARRGVRDHAAG